MNFVSFMAAGQNLILWVLTIVAGVAAIVSLIHASIQRSDAFRAVDKQTVFIWFFQAPSLFYLIGVVAVLVYIVDVRPRVDSIQGKSWFRKVGR